MVKTGAALRGKKVRLETKKRRKPEGPVFSGKKVRLWSRRAGDRATAKSEFRAFCSSFHVLAGEDKLRPYKKIVCGRGGDHARQRPRPLGARMWSRQVHFMVKTTLCSPLRRENIRTLLVHWFATLRLPWGWG